MLVKEFIQRYPHASFHMMTPGGFVDLSPEQAQGLLAGKKIMAHPGDPEYATTLKAEEVLLETVERIRWENQDCYMLTSYQEELDPVLRDKTEKEDLAGPCMGQGVRLC